MPYLHIVILYTTWMRVLYGTQFAMLVTTSLADEAGFSRGWLHPCCNAVDMALNTYMHDVM